MLDPHRLPERLVLLAGLSLFAALIGPTAFAVEPMIEGGNERGIDPARGLAAAGEQPLLTNAAVSGFDWGAALALVLIAFVVFGSVLALHDAVVRRGSRLATP